MPHRQCGPALVEHKSFTKLYRNSGLYRDRREPLTRSGHPVFNPGTSVHSRYLT